MYAYLSGLETTNELFTNNQPATLTVDQLVNQPTAIYISFDGLLDTRETPSGFPQRRTTETKTSGLERNYLWQYPKIEYDCWGVLRAYKNKKSYFSLGTSGNGSQNVYGKSFCFVFCNDGGKDTNLPKVNANEFSLHYELWNELVALANPSYMVDITGEGTVNKDDIPKDRFWNGETRTADYTKPISGTYRTFFKDNTKTQFAYEFDYHYKDNFDDLKIPVVGITLEDTLADSFAVNGNVESVKVAINYPTGTPEDKQKTVVNPKLNGNKVSFSVNSYLKGTELVFTIPVKVDDQKTVDVNTWTNTNSQAGLHVDLGDGNSSDYTVSSPKAHVEGYNITTEVIGGTITPGGGIREGGTRVISYAPNASDSANNSYYELDYIEVDGTKLTDDELKTFAEKYTFENVTKNHSIKVVYKEYFDLTGTKTWNDGGIEHNNEEDIAITVTRSYKDTATHTETLKPEDYSLTWDGNTYKISKLPVYQDEARNNKYTYKVTEKVTDAAKAKLHDKKGYENAQYADPKYDGYNIINNLKQEKVDFTGTKIWNDGETDHNNASEIKLVLHEESEKINKHQINNKYPDNVLSWNGNTFKYTGLNKYDEYGYLFKYSVRESNINGTATQNTDYTVKYDGKVWDYKSFEKPEDAFKVTAYETIENTISVNIPVTKTWVDGGNADETRPESIAIDLYVNGEKDDNRTLTLSAPEDNPTANTWEGEFKFLPRYDSDGNEIHYEVKEATVNEYTSAVQQREPISTYEYPKNNSDVTIDTSTKTTDSVTVTNGYDWEIQPGLRSDEIAGTKVVFNNNNMNVINTPFTEYDAKGNLVPTNERFFSVGSYRGNKYIMYNPSKDLENKSKRTVGSVIEISHYLEFRFKDAVTILDGTANGTTAEVVMTVNNISVVRTNTSNSQQRLLSGGVGAQGGGIGANSMDFNFKVSGVKEGTVLLSFVDIDVTNSQNYIKDRNETVYLMDGFDHTVYALPLGDATSTDCKKSNAEQRTIKGTSSTQKGPFTEFRVIESGGTPIFRARALKQDGSLGNYGGTLQSGFVARANLSENGFSLRWTGYDCGTTMFSQVKPFKVKATVDENITGFVGGSITNPTNWVYRDYGKPLVYTITPDNGYHISYIKLNGDYVDLNGFDENGYMQVKNTGWTRTQDPNNLNNGTQDIDLYQRGNGVVDVVLPAQYYAVLDTAPARVDHWIDASFASNGTASSYNITNTLTTSITGRKTWFVGANTHIDNSHLSFTLTRDGEVIQYNPSQMTWNADGTYVLSGLPKYAADGHEYIYVLEENVPAGYDGTKDGNNFINTLKQENITIQGKKTWNDGGRTHNNAADVVITLKRASTTDGVNYGSPETLDLVPVWEGDTYKFSNLEKYDAARFEYRYTVEEKLSDAFLATLAEGETYTSTPDDTGRNFVNTLTGTTTFTGTKIWSDGKTHNNDDEITLVLYWESAAISKRNTGLKRGTGEELKKGEYRLEWSGNTFTFSGLPKYDENGNLYTYSVRESNINGVQAKDSEYTILYDNEVWDYSSYLNDREAYLATAYETIENRLTPLVIRKTVPMLMLYEGNGDPAVTFKVQVKNKNGDIKYDNIVGLKLSRDTGYTVNEENGARIYELRIDCIPAVYESEDVVTVTEVYTAGYNNTKSEVTYISGEGVDVPYYECNITNDPGTTPPPGDGIVNHYKDGVFQYSSDGEPALPVEQ